MLGSPFGALRGALGSKSCTKRNCDAPTTRRRFSGHCLVIARTAATKERHGSRQFGGDLPIYLGGETADPKPKLSDEQAQVAKDLIEGGKSVSAVARNFKVSRLTIYRALERIDADV